MLFCEQTTNSPLRVTLATIELVHCVALVIQVTLSAIVLRGCFASPRQTHSPPSVSRMLASGHLGNTRVRPP